jgi:predicted nuclease with TOPRIM domain
MNASRDVTPNLSANKYSKSPMLAKNRGAKTPIQRGVSKSKSPAPSITKTPKPVPKVAKPTTNRVIKTPMIEIGHKVSHKGSELETMMRTNGENPSGDLPISTRKILEQLKSFGVLQHDDLKNLWERRKELVHEKETLMETNDNLTSTIKFGQKEIDGLKENNQSLANMMKNEKQKISQKKTAKIETSKVNDKKQGDLEKMKLQIAGAQKRIDKFNVELIEEEMASDQLIESLRKTQNDFMASNQSLRKLICQNSNLTNYFKDRLDDAVGRLDREQAENNRVVEDLIHTERERINSFADGSSMVNYFSLKKSLRACRSQARGGTGAHFRMAAPTGEGRALQEHWVSLILRIVRSSARIISLIRCSKLQTSAKASLRLWKS